MTQLNSSRISVLVIALGFVFACSGAQAVDFRRGDALGDGTLDISDVVFILTVLASPTNNLLNTTLPCRHAADADNDNCVDFLDSVYLINYIFFGGQVPPAPGPINCGPDSGSSGMSHPCIPAIGNPNLGIPAINCITYSC